MEKEIERPITEGTLHPTTPQTHSVRKVLRIALIVLIVAILVCGVYFWQHRKVTQLSTELKNTTTQLNSSKSKYDAAQKTVQSLEQQLASMKTGSSPSTANNSNKYDDPNFVAISPSSGYGTPAGTVTFSWTPNKYASYYVLELKRYGQADYPSNPDSNQFVRFASPQSQPATITLKYDFNPPTSTNYVWRVTAHAIINGVDTVIQSTSDNNLSIF